MAAHISIYGEHNMNDIHSTQVMDFMAGSAMIFSGFAIMADDLKAKLNDLERKVNSIQTTYQIEWTTLSVIAKQKGLTKDAIRKQLQNGDFEEGVDFKFDGNRIVVHQEAVVRLQRKRRSNNG